MPAFTAALLMASWFLLLGAVPVESIANTTDNLVTTADVTRVSPDTEEDRSEYRVAVTEETVLPDVQSTRATPSQAAATARSRSICQEKCQCAYEYGLNSVVLNCSSAYISGQAEGSEDVASIEVIGETNGIPLDICLFPEANKVIITEGNIVNVTLDSLICLEKLEVLQLSTGEMENIVFGGENEKDAVLNNTSSSCLYHLDVSHNKVKTFTNGTFIFFKSIKFLNLSHNRITSMNDVLQAFWVQNIEQLDLSFNRLDSIETGVLDGAVALRNLDLSHNSIASIEPGVFSCRLPNLQSLNLAHNSLSGLQEFTFSQLHKLQSLDLSHNSLPVVNGSAFDDDPLTACKSMQGIDSNSSQQSSRPWQHLDTLDLSHNHIASVGQDTLLHSLSNLHTLLLGHNEIQHLPKYGIESLKRLEWLDLQANRIDWLDVGTFTNARLRHINLAGNQLRKIISMAFLFLPKIQFIDLSHNRLNFLYKYAFYRICKQEHRLKISLNHNELGSDVIWKLWQTFRHLEQTGCSVQIDLHDNRIASLFQAEPLETIQKHFTLQDVPYFFSWDYIQMALGDNPIVCDCVLYSEVQTLKTISKTFKRSLSFPDNLNFWKSATCQSPIMLQNLTIQQALPMLTCPDVKDCPILCHCVFRPGSGLTYVNCSYRNLNVFPELLPRGPKALNFRGNNLIALPREFNLDNVTFLDLSDNQLISVNKETWKRMTASVKTVLLNNNMLTEIPGVKTGGSLSPLGSKKLALAGNPFSCKCGFKWVRDWVINNSRVIADAKDITCGDGRRLVLLRKDDFDCTKLKNSSTWSLAEDESSTDSSLNIPALAFAVSLFVCCLVIALLLTFRSRLRSALMKKSNWYKVHIEQERKFDVFLMLNDNDVAWTEHTIVSRLLAETNPYRVHVPQLEQSSPSWYRPHAFVLEQLQSGLESSKSTIMIASRSFISKELSDSNYVDIIRGALQVNKHRFYVVLLDDLQLCDLSSEIQSLLKKKYIFQAKDSFFLESLIQKLPSPTQLPHTEAQTSGLISSEAAAFNDLEDPLGNI